VDGDFQLVMYVKGNTLERGRLLIRQKKSKIKNNEKE